MKMMVTIFGHLSAHLQKGKNNKIIVIGLRSLWLADINRSKQPSRRVLVLKIYWKFTEHPCRRKATLLIEITLAWVFSRIFAAYFQNTFSSEHLWRAASELKRVWVQDPLLNTKFFLKILTMTISNKIYLWWCHGRDFQGSQISH